MYELMNLNPKGVSYNREQSGRTSNCVNARNGAGHNPNCDQPKCVTQRLLEKSPHPSHPRGDCADDCGFCIAQSAWWKANR